MELSGEDDFVVLSFLGKIKHWVLPILGSRQSKGSEIIPIASKSISASLYSLNCFSYRALCSEARCVSFYDAIPSA